MDLPPVENIGVDLFGEPGRLNYVTLARRWRRHKEVLTRVYVLTPRNGGGSLDGLLPPDHVITRSKNNETDRWETPLLAEVLAREPPYDTLLRGGQWSSLSLARVSGLFSHIPGICTDWGPAPHRLASREQPLALCSSGPGWWHWQKYRCWVPYSAEVNAKLEAVMDEGESLAFPLFPPFPMYTYYPAPLPPYLALYGFRMLTGPSSFSFHVSREAGGGHR